jgi:hypothetical protein
MAMLAVYYPKPGELIESIVIVLIAYLVLCGLSWRMKLSLPLAAILMAAGCCVALAPDLSRVVREDLGVTGDHSREWSGTNYSDAFFAVTAYMYVDRGKLVAVMGMSMAIFGYASVVACRSRSAHKKSLSSQTIHPDSRKPPPPTHAAADG